jgi:predicted nucleic acid-binding protein
MTIDRDTLLFFDASCLIAAAGSPSGGSGFLLSLCASGYLKAIISQPVLLEAQRNIQKKLGDNALKRFFALLAVVPFALASLPEETELKRLDKLVNNKDVHVLAAALELHVPFLLTLDKEFISEVNEANVGVQALTPGEFIKTIIPQHRDFPDEIS